MSRKLAVMFKSKTFSTSVVAPEFIRNESPHWEKLVVKELKESVLL